MKSTHGAVRHVCVRSPRVFVPMTESWKLRTRMQSTLLASITELREDTLDGCSSGALKRCILESLKRDWPRPRNLAHTFSRSETLGKSGRSDAILASPSVSAHTIARAAMCVSCVVLVHEQESPFPPFARGRHSTGTARGKSRPLYKAASRWTGQALADCGDRS